MILQMARTNPMTSFTLVGVVLVAALVATLSIYTSLPVVWVYVASISIVAFLLCGYDKTIAGGATTRVPERILLGSALIGGTLGLIAGMLLFRHKVSKTSFKGWLFLVVVAQALGAYAFYTMNLQEQS